MKKLMIGLVAAALLPLSASLQAKDICIASGPEKIKFVAVKSLKKPGSTATLKGIYVESGSLVAPITGTAMTNADGTIALGFTWHTMGTGVGRDVTFSAAGLDQALVGTYSYSSDGDLTVDDTLLFQTMNCKDFVLPPLV